MAKTYDRSRRHIVGQYRIFRAFTRNLSFCDRFLIVITVLATVFGVFCRLEGLTRRSLWLDEVITIRRISFPTVLNVVSQLQRSPFPPLYYSVLWLWTSVWGVSPASLRSLPVILGLLAMPTTYLIWKRLIGRRAALWALVLVSAAAYPIWQSQDGKMYAAVWLLATIVSGSFLHALADRPRRRMWLAIYALSNAALLLVSYVGVVPILIQGIFGAILALRGRAKVRLVFDAAVAALLSSVPLMIWVARTHQVGSNRKEIDWIPPTSGGRFFGELYQHFVVFLLGVHPARFPAPDNLVGRLLTEGTTWMLVLIGGVVVAYWARLIWGAAIARDRDSSAQPSSTFARDEPTRAELGAYLTLWAILPLIGVSLFSILVFPLSGIPRYMAASVPGLFLLVASALAALKTRGFALVVGLALLAVNVPLVVFGKIQTSLVPWRDLVRTASQVARALPGPGGDLARFPHVVSLVHRDNLSFKHHDYQCVEYELAHLGPDGCDDGVLRLEPLSEAVRRGECFLIVGHDTLTVPAEETRRAIGRSIAELAGPVRFALREIETVRVFMGEHANILPNALSRHCASLWLAQPVRSGHAQARGAG